MSLYSTLGYHTSDAKTKHVILPPLKNSTQQCFAPSKALNHITSRQTGEGQTRGAKDKTENGANICTADSASVPKATGLVSRGCFGWRFTGSLSITAGRTSDTNSDEEEWEGGKGSPTTGYLTSGMQKWVGILQMSCSPTNDRRRDTRS